MSKTLTRHSVSTKAEAARGRGASAIGKVSLPPAAGGVTKAGAAAKAEVEAEAEAEVGAEAAGGGCGMPEA